MNEWGGNINVRIDNSDKCRHQQYTAVIRSV